MLKLGRNRVFLRKYCIKTFNLCKNPVSLLSIDIPRLPAILKISEIAQSEARSPTIEMIIVNSEAYSFTFDKLPE
jgi:hypothetical protein